MLTEAAAATYRQGVDSRLLARERSLQQMLNAEAEDRYALLGRSAHGGIGGGGAGARSRNLLTRSFSLSSGVESP